MVETPVRFLRELHGARARRNAAPQSTLQLLQSRSVISTTVPCRWVVSAQTERWDEALVLVVATGRKAEAEYSERLRLLWIDSAMK